MKKRKKILEELKEFPYFNKKVIKELCLKHNLSLATVNSYIHKGTKNNEVVRLKNGFYVTKEFYDKNIEDIGYVFFIANQLRNPSYISSWIALDYYNMTTNVINTVTSVTTKVTRDYSNKVGNFTYKSIKNELFKGFSSIKSRLGFDYLIASPAKALFDLIYLNTNQFRTFEPDILKRLRIDTEEMSNKSKKEFKKLLKENKITWKIF
jgi:predicted transcriptional regulator of viral defense system